MEIARLQSCQRCNELFLVCGWVNRRYCNDACAELARQESRRRAHRRYRHSPEGQEQHRDEERGRRDRRRVGDQFVRSALTDASVAIEAPRGVVAPRRATAGLARWRVFVGARLVEAAERLRASRAVVACAACGRQGVVVEVIVWGEQPRGTGKRRAHGRKRERVDDGA